MFWWAVCVSRLRCKSSCNCRLSFLWQSCLFINPKSKLPWAEQSLARTGVSFHHITYWGRNLLIIILVTIHGVGATWNIFVWRVVLFWTWQPTSVRTPERAWMHNGLNESRYPLVMSIVMMYSCAGLTQQLLCMHAPTERAGCWQVRGVLWHRTCALARPLLQVWIYLSLFSMVYIRCF